LRVLIIGSGGFIGENLHEYLRWEGISALGVTSGDGSGINPKTGLLPDDFSIPTMVDAVFYLAQSPYYRQADMNIQHLWNVNVISAARAADISRRANVKRFIYASTGNVYKPIFFPMGEDSLLNRDDYYSLSKIHAEEILRSFKHDISITVLRLFGIYGPGQRDKIIPNLIKAVLQKDEVYIEKNPLHPYDYNGLQVSFCHIDDLLRIFARLLYLDTPPVLNIGGEKAISIREVAISIASFLGKEVSFRILDRNREGDLIADISLLKKVLSPQFTSFHQGLTKTLEFAVQNQQFWKD
jgi:UDP-glucose 4-epimerase